MKDQMKMVLEQLVDSLTGLKIKLEQFSRRASDRAYTVGHKVGFMAGTFVRSGLNRIRRQ